MTSVPAEVISRFDLGHISLGAVADVMILILHEGTSGFVDVIGEKMCGQIEIRNRDDRKGRRDIR